MTQRLLIGCGLVASLLYVGMNVVVPMQWPGYSSAAQTVSELSAIDAPTRPLWVPLGVVYTVLMLLFGKGVWRASRRRSLRVTGGAIMLSGVLGLYWPPMHQRAVIGAGGGSLTDTLHIAWGVATVALMLVAMGSGAAALGRSFRRGTLVAVAILVVFGVLTFLDSPRLADNLPTPWIGVWERINIGAYLAWVVALGATLLGPERPDLTR